MANEQELTDSGQLVVGGGKVAVVAPDGTAGTIDASRLEEFVSKGYRPESGGAYDERLAKEKYESAGGQVRAGAEGLARGATLGLSDVIQREVGVSAKDLRERRERNPGIATVTEIGGAVLPSLVTGGAAAPSALAARGGAGVAKALGGGLAGAVGGGVAEGALFGAGQGITNLALSEDPITAEAVFSELGSNALYGALAGGAGAGVAYGAAKGGEKLLGALQRQARDLSESLAAKAAGPGDDVLEAIARKPDKAAATAAAKDLNTRAAVLRKEILAEEKSLAGAVKQAASEADEVTAKTTETLKKQVTDLDSYVGRNLKQAEKKLASLAPEESAALKTAVEEVQATRKLVQEQLGLASEGGGAKAAKARRFKVADDELVRTALSTDGRELLNRYAQAQNGLQKALGNKDYGLAPLSALDDLGKVPKLEPPPTLAAKRAELAEVDSQLLRHRSGGVDADAAKELIAQATEAGLVPPTPDDLRPYHRGLGAPAPGSNADLAAQAAFFRDQAAKKLASQPQGPTGLVGKAVDRLAGGAGGAVGSAVGGVIGGFPGAFVGREIGSTAGDLLRGIVGGKLSQTAAGVSKRISDGIEAFMGAAQKPLKAAPGVGAKVLANVRYAPSTPAAGHRDKPDDVKDRMRELALFKADPEPMKKQIYDRLAPVRAADPKLGAQLYQSAITRLAYLVEKMPKRDYEPPIGARDTWVPTDGDRNTFERVAGAVEDAVTALAEGLQTGHLTPEVVDAVRVTSPEVFAAFQRELVRRLPELQEDLPYSKRLMLGYLFDVTADPTMDPGFVAGMQTQFAKEPGTEGGMRPPMASKADIGSIKKRPETTEAQRLRGGM